jgi:hypothetical protein
MATHQHSERGAAGSGRTASPRRANLLDCGFDKGRYENKALVQSCLEGQLIERVGEEYLSNHHETDTRALFHVLRCPSSTVTIYSPDSDVLMVGLLTFPTWSAAVGPAPAGKKQLYLQISRLQGEVANQPGIVDVNKLVHLLENHPDLHDIEAGRRVKFLVSPFVLMGCDFVSFFSGISKRQFLKEFFQEAHFINGAAGFTLADWDGPLRSTPASMLAAIQRAEKTGQATLAVPPEFGGAVIAFLLTIGAAYFQRYKNRMGEESAARSHTTLIVGANPKDALGAEKWLDRLQDKTWTATSSKEENVPSVGALIFHFLKGILVLIELATAG